MRPLAAFLVLGLGSQGGRADDVRLKNGNTLVGLAREEGSQIVLEVPSDTVTLWKSDVESIVPGRTLLHEYHEKLKAIEASKDAGDYYTLALWCRDRGLPGYVGRVLRKTVALDPDHKEARALLASLSESDAAPFQPQGEGQKAPGFAPFPKTTLASGAPRRVEVPTLYMGVSPYRDDHSRYRNYSRYRSRGGRWYGPRVFGGGGHIHLHGSQHGAGHQEGHR